MRALNTDSNHSTNKICTLSCNENGCCYIGTQNYFESRLWWLTKTDQQIKLSLGGCCIHLFKKLASCFVNKGLVQRKFRLTFHNFPFFWAAELKFWIVVVVVVFLISAQTIKFNTRLNFVFILFFLESSAVQSVMYY